MLISSWDVLSASDGVVFSCAKAASRSSVPCSLASFLAFFKKDRLKMRTSPLDLRSEMNSEKKT